MLRCFFLEIMRYNQDVRTSNVISALGGEQTNKCCNLCKCFVLSGLRTAEKQIHVIIIIFLLLLRTFVQSRFDGVVIMTFIILYAVRKLMSLNRKNDSDNNVQMWDEMQLRTKITSNGNVSMSSFLNANLNICQWI